MSQQNDIVFITGVSGGGKTTLGEGLAGYTHFDVDVWAFGGDAIGQAGQTADPSWGRSDELTKIYKRMESEGWGAIMKGSTPPMDVWTDFYDLVIPDILSAVEAHHKVVVSHSVYLRSVRDYIRSKIDGVKFVILDVPAEVSAERKVAAIRKTCDERGFKTLGEFFASFHPEYDGPQLPDSEIIAMMTGSAQAGANAFQSLQDDEGENSLGIQVTADLSKEDIVARVTEFLK